MEGKVLSARAPGRITHVKRLKGARGELASFLRVTATLGKQRGPIVFQLPPFFPKDASRLASFLKDLPRGPRFAFEFRHSSWFCQEIIALLKKKRAALCLNDADVEGCPLAATSDWGILKLRRTRYSRKELVRRLEDARRQPWKDVYVFFKHEARATGPKLAARWMALSGQRLTGSST